jgi:hypothetical protein
MKKKSPRRIARLAKALPPLAWAASVLARARALLPIAGFLLTCLLPMLLPADWFHSRLWKGYYTVVLRSTPQSAAHQPESGAGSLGPTVSRQTASVSFNTFAGLASVRVADLPSRLDSADPRLDPFMRGIEAYFRGPAGELAYARTRRGLLVSGLGRLGPGRQVLELDPVAALLRLLLLIGAALLVLLPAQVPHVPRWLLGLGLLPWILSVPTGDLRDLLAFLLLYPFWVRAMVWAATRQPGAARGASSKAGLHKSGLRKLRKLRKPRPAWLPAALEPARVALAGLAARQPAIAALHPRRKKPASAARKPATAARKPATAASQPATAARRPAAAARAPAVAPRKPAAAAAAVPVALLLLGAAVFLLAAPGVGHLPGTLFALAADLCLLAMLPAARRWERSRRAHPLFRALPILGTLRADAGRRRPRLSVPALVVPAALALLALASAAALSLEAHRRDLQAPRLEASGPRGLSWDTLAALPLTSDPQGLPHLADFLAHRAFQECLAFQRPYRFPAPGERVYISGYAAAGAGYVQSQRVARRFAESWLSQTLAAAPPGSVERMLADQGRAAAVRRVGEPQLMRELAPWPRAAAVALFLLACLTAAIRSGTRTLAL